MIPFTEKEKKRFTTLLINSRVVYWYQCSEPNYIEHLEENLKMVDDGHWYASKYDIQVKSMREIYGMIKSHKMTNMDIKECSLSALSIESSTSSPYIPLREKSL